MLAVDFGSLLCERERFLINDEFVMRQHDFSFAAQVEDGFRCLEADETWRQRTMCLLNFKLFLKTQNT